MRVLVTGGCGFIGTNLISKLTEIGSDFEICVFDDESLGRREHLGRFTGKFVKGDLRDRSALDSALDGVDTVVHLAADTRVMDSIANPLHNFDVNVVGTLNLLEAMRSHGVHRLVSASTGGAIIGDIEPPVHERMVPNPLSPYGASKLAVEGYCAAYSASYDMRCLSLRFSNVYGPRSYHKGSVVAAFFKRILAGEALIVYGDGSQTRDYVFVGDICDGIIAGLYSQAIGPIQLGSGRPVSLHELLDRMRDVVAPLPLVVKHEPFRQGEVLATYCDISKARRELEFEPRKTLREGLDLSWSWFQEHASA